MADKKIPLEETMRYVAGEGESGTEATTKVILGWANEVVELKQAVRELGEAHLRFQPIHRMVTLQKEDKSPLEYDALLTLIDNSAKNAMSMVSDETKQIVESLK